MIIKPSPGTEIPDNEILFRYFNPKIIPEGQDEIPVSIFQDIELSCDWERIRQNPYSSYHISEGLSGIIAITINDSIRNPVNPKRTGEKVPAWHQEIIYDPVTTIDDKGHEPNLAHSLIVGSKKNAITEAIRDSSVIINI